MSQMPLVSVLMPVYNAEADTFKTAVESILNQTYKNFEFIIINDGSTNNTEEVILSFKDERIRYFKNNKNLKIIKTLNIGLELARGKYIARLDSDDYCDKTRLEKQVKYLEENPEIGLLGTYYEHVPENRVVAHPFKPDEVKLYLRGCQNCILHSSAMFRKSVLDKLNLKYNECALHAEDYMLWSNISNVTGVAIYPEVLTFYRSSASGISSSNRFVQQKMVIVILLGNLIKDFPCDKQLMSKIQMKYAKSEMITEDEYNVIKKFLSEVEEFLYKNISPPFNSRINSLLSAIPAGFVKSKAE